MTGTGQGPSILAWIRYHTNAELSDLIAKGKGKMQAVTLTEADRQSLMSDLRALAGTNPNMATAGFTGARPARRAVRGRSPQEADSAATPLLPVAAKASPDRTGKQATIPLSGGPSLTGKILTDYTNAVTMLTADGKVRLLARNGDDYSEKKIEPVANWTTYHGMIGGSRYSSLEQINTTNISKLAPAWAFPMPSAKGNGRGIEATPIVVDGIMYVTGWNAMHALDATTGQELWSYSEPHHDGIVSDAGLGANRGAAISDDRIFMVTDHAHLLAFDRKIGTKLWDTEIGNYKELVSTTAAPMIVGDLVISGMSGGEEGVRGYLDAYKISTGERAWRFYTIPARGEKGSETWIGAALEHGGGPTWLTGSYDPTIDTLYWAVGNPCPDMNGEERKGDNLYTSSVVALNPKNGQLKWYYQFTPPDTHDWDAVQPMLLVDEQWLGRPRKLLMHGDRNGMFYVLDRTNGEFLMATKLSTKVTWNNGYTKDGKPILADTFEATPTGVTLCPTGNGGANWQEASYSPLTKLFYARVQDGCGIFQSSPDPLNAGNRWFGAANRPSPEAQKALADVRADYRGGTFIRAIDPFTGKKVWDYPATGGRTGVLTTAGGLAFIGGDGGLAALNAKTGEKLWSIDFGQNSQASAMTYMVGGKQYVALSGSTAMIAYAIP
jgi:alcohol dehydrogenase (cytochrome c)